MIKQKAWKFKNIHNHKKKIHSDGELDEWDIY